MPDQDHIAKTMFGLGTPPKPATPHLGAPENMVRCACGKKWIPFEDVRMFNTGVCTATDSICKECRNDVAKHAMIVCCKCQAVVARVPPQHCPGGFRYEPNRCYHIVECPNCNPDVEVSAIIEKKIFDREQGPAKIIVNSHVN